MSAVEWQWEDHRVSDEEAAEDIDRLRPLAKEFLFGYEGDNHFLIDIQENSLHRLTVRQVRGVLNCMRMYGRGRRILERGPKPEPEPAPKPEPWYPETCPLVLRQEEHDRHWFPLLTRSGSQRCPGWHALTRDITYVRARFHAPYLRGRKSNLIHRSAYEGEVVWFPDRFHQEGGAHVARWYVRMACSPGARWLTCPETLTAEQVKVAEPVEVGETVRVKEITLCRLCFPGTDGEPLWKS